MHLGGQGEGEGAVSLLRHTSRGPSATASLSAENPKSLHWNQNNIPDMFLKLNPRYIVDLHLGRVLCCPMSTTIRNSQGISQCTVYSRGVGHDRNFWCLIERIFSAVYILISKTNIFRGKSATFRENPALEIVQ